eukprot:5454510-Pleurochrysis_carterae.AAC.3
MYNTAFSIALIRRHDGGHGPSELAIVLDCRFRTCVVRFDAATQSESEYDCSPSQTTTTVRVEPKLTF